MHAHSRHPHTHNFSGLRNEKNGQGRPPKPFDTGRKTCLFRPTTELQYPRAPEVKKLVLPGEVSFTFSQESLHYPHSHWRTFCVNVPTTTGEVFLSQEIISSVTPLFFLTYPSLSRSNALHVAAPPAVQHICHRGRQS